MLKLRPRWLEYLDTFVILLLASGLIIFPFLVLQTLYKTTSNFSYVPTAIVFLSMTFGSILFYKKLTEKRLTRIFTGLTKIDTKKKIIEFMRSHDFKVINNNANLVIGFREGNILSSPRQLNVLLDIDSIYVCVLTINSKVRLPSILNARNIINQLKQFILE